MKFLADMGVSLGVVDWLRRQGHDAKHLRDESLQRAADLDVFTKAIAEERVVLTFDLDFGEIAALSGGRKASVILFRLHNPRALLTQGLHAFDILFRCSHGGQAPEVVGPDGFDVGDLPGAAFVGKEDDLIAMVHPAQEVEQQVETFPCLRVVSVPAGRPATL